MRKIKGVHQPFGVDIKGKNKYCRSGNKGEEHMELYCTERKEFRNISLICRRKRRCVGSTFLTLKVSKQIDMTTIF